MDSFILKYNSSIKELFESACRQEPLNYCGECLDNENIPTTHDVCNRCRFYSLYKLYRKEKEIK